MLDKLDSGDCTSGDLNAIRQFLKDNNIDCIGSMNDTIIQIKDALPDFDTDESIRESLNEIAL